ncbi:MAG TPA: hypothetical protein PLC28_19095 [Spirochaetota bacterium]|nr:hypothetical protein [Spirochaetota bacterium]HQJ72818.1 hypothetical protein [Spirochaetota bacterium]
MKTKITAVLSFIIMIVIYCVQANAATIVLRSGVTVKGKLVDRTDEEITIQDPDTRQMRVIKSIFVRDLVLEADEQKLVEKLEKKKKGKDLKLRGGDEGEDLLKVLQPSIGIMPGIALPVGKIASKVQLGYGALLFCDTGIPMKTDMFKMRFGLSVGFLYHQTKSTKASSSIMMLPVVAYTKLQFVTPVGARPYIKLGGGITYAKGGPSAIEPTIAAAFGLGYVNNKIPFMEFFLEAGYMRTFEKLSSDFVTVNLGVAYRFGAPPAAPTIKVEEKKK